MKLIPIFNFDMKEQVEKFNDAMDYHGKANWPVVQIERMEVNPKDEDEIYVYFDLVKDAE